MKKLAVLILSVLMIAGLCGCGESKDSADNSGDYPELKTLGDALAVDSELNQASWNSEKYVYVFEYDGKPLRVTAPMTEELYEQVDAVDFFADDKDAKIAEIVGGQEIEKIEDLSVNIPSQESLDELKGKKGADLIDEGYEVWGHYYDGTVLEVTMVKGDYEYTATFEGDINAEVDDFDAEAEITDLTVKEVIYEGISGNASYTINY